jgi:hypothetical protein
VEEGVEEEDEEVQEEIQESLLIQHKKEKKEVFKNIKSLPKLTNSLNVIDNIKKYPLSPPSLAVLVRPVRWYKRKTVPFIFSGVSASLKQLKSPFSPSLYVLHVVA